MAAPVKVQRKKTKKPTRPVVPPDAVAFSDEFDCWVRVQSLTDAVVAQIEAHVSAGKTWLQPDSSGRNRAPAPVDRSSLALIFSDRTTQEELAGVARLPWLTRVSIGRSYDEGEAPSFITDLSPLAALQGLRHLTVDSPFIADLSPLAGLTNLETLELAMADPIAELGPLRGLTALRTLSLRGGRITELSALAPLTALERLNLVGLQAQELGPLAGHGALEALDVRHATRLRDLSALASTPSLRELTLRGSAVRDLGPLAKLRNLQWLMLEDTHVTDVRPLFGLGETLAAVALPGGVPEAQVEALKAACPRARVEQYSLPTPQKLAELVADGRMAPA